MLQRKREVMWSSFHQLTTSEEFVKNWEKFLTDSISASPNPIFYQYVTECILKAKIKTMFLITAHSVNDQLGTLSYQEKKCITVCSRVYTTSNTQKDREVLQPC